MKQKNEEYHIINDIKCKIVYEKIKNTYIQIKDGEVIIKTSPRSSIKYVEDVVNSKADWINKKLQEQSRKINTTYKDGSTVRVLGKPYTLKIMYVDSKRNKLNMDNQYLYCDLNKDCKENEQENVKKLIDKLYKYIATEEVPSAMEDLKNRTGLAPLECSIKNNMFFKEKNKHKSKPDGLQQACNRICMLARNLPFKTYEPFEKILEHGGILYAWLQRGKKRTKKLKCKIFLKKG